MPQVRRLGNAIAVMATMLLVFTSMASAHPGPTRFGPYRFDSIWIGTSGADTYTAEQGSRDRIIGRAGNDVLDGNDGRDVVRGNRGDDVLSGGDASDRIYGGLGADRIDGGDGPDLVSGGYGADGINGGGGHDLIQAGPGADTIVATDGVRDWVFCGRGKDTVIADKIDRVHRSCEDVTRVSSAD